MTIRPRIDGDPTDETGAMLSVDYGGESHVIAFIHDARRHGSDSGYIAVDPDGKAGAVSVDYDALVSRLITNWAHQHGLT